MPFTPAEPVASGRPYSITEVDGRAPANLTDFVGETSFKIRDRDRERKICGLGTPRGETVRFQEKDITGSTKDVRTWHITQRSETFVAEHAAAY